VDRHLDIASAYDKAKNGASGGARPGRGRRRANPFRGQEGPDQPDVCSDATKFGEIAVVMCAMEVRCLARGEVKTHVRLAIERTQ
jgi:hypothetical protein